MAILNDKVRHNITGFAWMILRHFAAWFRGENLQQYFLYLFYAGLAGISVKIIAALWFYFSWSPALKLTETQKPASAVSRQPGSGS